MIKILSTALLLGGAYVAYQPVLTSAPDLAQSVGRIFHSAIGYSTDSCKADPSACLESRRVALGRSKADIEAAIAALRVEIDKVAAIENDNDLMLAKNVAFLDQGKAVLKGALTSAQRLDFAGRSYPDAATLRSQLETLFSENKMLTDQVTQSRDLKGKLDARLQQLRSERVNVESAVAILPSQISLIQADMSLASLSKNLALIDTALKSSDHQVSDATDLIGTTAELAKRSEDVTGLSQHQQEISAAFDRFLAQ